jgi:uncharacterized membrane protein YvbJ
MALITCSECGNAVSSNAAACPKCGNPIAEAPVVKSTGTQITTVQSTAKRFKMHKLIAVAMFFCGLLVAIASGQGGPTSTGIMIGSLLALAGIVLYIVARARTWWHHG